MYFISKLVWFFLEPSNLLTFSLIGVFLLAGHGWGRMRIAGLGIALSVLVIGLSPLGTLLLLPLEQRFPAYRDDGKPVAGAIVLGGAVDPEVTAARGSFALNEAGERVLALMTLSHRYPNARLVFTGGSGELTGVLSEADAVEQALATLAPDLKISFERNSRNTLENAEMTRALVSPQPGERWLLVTSAWHMPRATGLFRKAGFDVMAYPVDFRTVGDARDFRPFSAVSHGLRRTDLATKEWAGLVFAYLTGKTAVPFPAP